MTDLSLLMPPIAFAVLLLVCLGFSSALTALAFRRNGVAVRMVKPYACGEESPSRMIRPNYGQFLPFALFFTILHVVALIVCTVPVETPAAFVIAVLYVLGAVVGLTILYRK